MSQIGSVGIPIAPLLPADDQIALAPYSPPIRVPIQSYGVGSGQAGEQQGVQSTSGNDRPVNESTGNFSWSKTKVDGFQSPDSAERNTAAGGTNIFNDLSGRDPDLIHGGEKFKLANGSTYTATDSDTLTSVARKTGNSVSQLIQQNGMNAGLLGKNDSNKYFSVGDMTMSPTPGTTVVEAIPEPSRTDAAQATKAGDPENQEKLASLLKFAESLADGKKDVDLVRKAMDDPASMTAADSAKLSELQELKDGDDAKQRPEVRNAIA